jgi:hypothetical protein
MKDEGRRMKVVGSSALSSFIFHPSSFPLAAADGTFWDIARIPHR